MEKKIGEAAGKIWQTLSKAGPLGRTELTRSTGLSGDLLNQGIGWLAREGKLGLVTDSKRNEQLTIKR